MRVTRTLLLLAVSVLLAACSSNAGGLVDPTSASVSHGTGMLGTGNSVSTAIDSTSMQRGTGMLGTGN